MKDLKKNGKETRKRRVREKINRLKALKSKYGRKMTVASLTQLENRFHSKELT